MVILKILGKNFHNSLSIIVCSLNGFLHGIVWLDWKVVPHRAPSRSSPSLVYDQRFVINAREKPSERSDFLSMWARQEMSLQTPEEKERWRLDFRVWCRATALRSPKGSPSTSNRSSKSGDHANDRGVSVRRGLDLVNTVVNRASDIGYDLTLNAVNRMRRKLCLHNAKWQFGDSMLRIDNHDQISVQASATLGLLARLQQRDLSAYIHVMIDEGKISYIFFATSTMRHKGSLYGETRLFDDKHSRIRFMFHAWWQCNLKPPAPTPPFFSLVRPLETAFYFFRVRLPEVGVKPAGGLMNTLKMFSFFFLACTSKTSLCLQVVGATWIQEDVVVTQGQRNKSPQKLILVPPLCCSKESRNASFLDFITLFISRLSQLTTIFLLFPLWPSTGDGLVCFFLCFLGQQKEKKLEHAHRADALPEREREREGERREREREREKAHKKNNYCEFARIFDNERLVKCPRAKWWNDIQPYGLYFSRTL